MMSTMPIDAATLLARAMRVFAAAHNVTIRTMSIADRRWASATFEGHRHDIRLTLDRVGARAWLALLPEAELPMRGCILADLAIDGISEADGVVAAALTALTIAEH